MIDALAQNAYPQEVYSNPFSIISPLSTPNLHQLYQTFIYTQLLKITILHGEYDHNAHQVFTDFSLQHLQQYNLRI